jgi:NitT/TauT family transport system permease protein/sulfonate transport system permease protein
VRARRPWPSWLADAAVALAVLGWWLVARELPDFALAGPWDTGLRMLALFTDPSFLGHTLASTVRVLLSVVLALAIGGGLALLARGVPASDWVVHHGALPFFNSFPSIGWAILAAIWFTPGHFAIVFVQIAILIPFCLINVAQGLRELDRELLEMGRSFTRSRPRLLALLTVPLLMPYVLGALRIAYGIGWKIAIVSELLGATSGLGFLMLQAQSSADVTTVMAACLAIVVLFVAGERLLIDPLARRFAAA